MVEYSGVSLGKYLSNTFTAVVKRKIKIVSWGTSVNLKPKTFIDGLENISLIT